MGNQHTVTLYTKISCSSLAINHFSARREQAKEGTIRDGEETESPRIHLCSIEGVRQGAEAGGRRGRLPEGERADNDLDVGQSKRPFRE